MAQECTQQKHSKHAMVQLRKPTLLGKHIGVLDDKNGHQPCLPGPFRTRNFEGEPTLLGKHIGQVVDEIDHQPCLPGMPLLKHTQTSTQTNKPRNLMCEGLASLAYATDY